MLNVNARSPWSTTLLVLGIAAAMVLSTIVVDVAEGDGVDNWYAIVGCGIGSVIGFAMYYSTKAAWPRRRSPRHRVPRDNANTSIGERE